ncbi:MAG: fumarylacetoacetase [Candidatus Pseudomonas phytovorans]|uniref:fumarylacetoacetase n=1 Tax=Candidatus Pseudomonas phytovorans TaxID=3121377 RepID=A0AAJ6B9B1_9PSED|nr:fumarylacetoacetase [Pseudomonas sp.]WEK28503.1 MAG: fumarylacetoacetase [Pseudomonas sp.]
MNSWVTSANGHPDFSLANLPFGVFSVQGGERRTGVAIGDFIYDLKVALEAGLLTGAAEAAAEAAVGGSLNSFFALPRHDRKALRERLIELLCENGPEVETQRKFGDRLLIEASRCNLHVPARIQDYTDFYVGIHHAENVGKLFRPDNPLLPNYKYVPIGYHGRASTIVPSGQPFVRPSGQIKLPDSDVPIHAPSRRLDYELELGLWIGRPNGLGEPIDIRDAREHIAGFCLLNDWSARDIQAWEYQPLGPFLSKSFASTISPWVVTAEALEPFRIAQPARPSGDPAPLPYLLDEEDQSNGAFDIRLEVLLLTASMREEGAAPYPLSVSTTLNMYWTFAQMVAHHTVNGCQLNPGDLFGTGTLSGPTTDSMGSLLEMTQGGKHPITLPNGESRTFLEDGDEIILRARCTQDGVGSIGFGECRAVVLPAREIR